MEANAVVWKSVAVVDARIDGEPLALRQTAHNVVNIARRSLGGATAWDATLVLVDDDVAVAPDDHVVDVRMSDRRGRTIGGDAILTRVMPPVLQLLGRGELDGFDWDDPGSADQTLP